jgi:hypothetical protein
MPYQPTIADLRAAFARVPLLHLRGWTFERAMVAPLVRWSLIHVARAQRERLETAAGRRLPYQPTLI